MANTGPIASRAALHYLAPVAPTVYFWVAKTVAACLLQEASKGAGLKWRQYLTAGLALAVATTITAEGILVFTRVIKETQSTVPQDYIVYLILMFAVHALLALGLIGKQTPIWHPYLGAWSLAFAIEVSSIVLRAINDFPHQDTERVAFALQCLRAFLFLVLAVALGFFVLKDRNKSIKLDDETETLLADEDATRANRTSGRVTKSSRRNSSNGSGDSTDSDSDDDGDNENDAFGFDSDSEEPDQDKELRKQQRRRLKASGNWINYLMGYKVFLPMLWPSKQPFIQACLAVIGLTIVAQRALNILSPRQLGIITDELTKYAGTGIFPWQAVGLGLLYAALGSRAGISLIKSLAEIPVEQNTYKAVATNAFSHVMGLSMDFHSDKNSGELIRAIEQGTNLEWLLTYMFFEVLPVFFDLVVAVFYVTVLFDVYMALILIGVGVSYVWIGAKVTIWNLEQRRKYNTVYRQESKVKNEAINNWLTVSHFNRSSYESERYNKTMDEFMNASWKYYLMYNLGAGAQAFVMMAGELLAILLAVYRVTQGQAPVGNFIALLTYWSSIESPLAIVSYSMRRITQMLTDSERLLQLLNTRASILDAPDAKELDVTHGEVTFEEVDFAYDPRKPILSKISFTVPAGKTVALVGETGGGKSTILKLLYRYYDVCGGAIRIDGQDVRAVTQDSLRGQFGMVPQDPALFNVSILENLRYARLDATEAEVQAACAAAAIHDKILSFPDGYASMVGERGVKLSGGELQRVAIARAILRDPRIVLLDEATSMIDAETEALIQTAFRRLTADRTTFIVAHRLSTIQHADLILVIGDGGILERGTHEELLRQNGKYVKLWSRQLSKETELVQGAKAEDLIELAGGDQGGDPAAIS